MRAAIIRHTLRSLKSQWWPATQIASWQEQQLIRMMRHAVTAVPFYRRLGIDAATLVSAADLTRFPILHKRDVQADPDGFLAEGVERKRLRSSRTSGTTGEPTVTWFDEDSWALTKYALKIRRILAVTSPWFRRLLIVNEQLPEVTDRYRKERAFGTGFLYSERIVSLYDDMTMHRQTISEFRPDMVYAFPSFLLELLRSYAQAGEAPPAIRTLFTSSETLTPAARQEIETSFQGRLFDLYGSTEFKEVAWQCRAGRYHLNFESVHLEAPPREAGEHGGPLLLSSLANRAMPLLRFNTGDLGSLGDSTCSCGRHTPQLVLTRGRVDDMLQLPSGRRLFSDTLTSLVEALPGVQQYRILHEQPARFVVQLVSRERPSSEIVEGCRRRMLQALCEPVEILMEHVPGFDRAGKHQVFVRLW
jgi:phenylacetate-CoA ligase